MLSTKSCFLFDLDGTLIDSSALHEAAFRHVLTKHTPECLNKFDYETHKGQSTADVFRALGLCKEDVIVEMVMEKQNEYRRRVATGLKPLSNAADLLSFLTQSGRRLFLVTGSSQTSVKCGLSATGMSNFFEGIVTADDVIRPKPDPEPYLFCMKKYGLSIDECVAIEDAMNGIQSAQAAGLDVIGVNNPLLANRINDFFSDLFALGNVMGQNIAHVSHA
jgi:HAD superfamily hydrolase (TIGR01509 family)